METLSKLALVHLVAVTLFGNEAPEVIEIDMEQFPGTTVNASSLCLIVRNSNVKKNTLQVQCSLNWLHVKLKAPVIGDWYLLSDEVFLGHGCPVTNVWQDLYMFIYPTSDCGIQSWVLRRKVIFKTSLTLISRTLPRRGYLPISCVVQQDKFSSQIAASFIDPRQALALASPAYQDYSLSNAKCLKLCLYTPVLKYFSLPAKTDEVKEVPEIGSLHILCPIFSLTGNGSGLYNMM